jgi:hypothetical protein
MEFFHLSADMTRSSKHITKISMQNSNKHFFGVPPNPTAHLAVTPLPTDQVAQAILASTGTKRRMQDETLPLLIL